MNVVFLHHIIAILILVIHSFVFLVRFLVGVTVTTQTSLS